MGKNVFQYHGHDSISLANNVMFSVKCLNTHTIKSLNDKAHLICEAHRIKWTQDLDSLRLFIKNVVGLYGSWRSPGGKAKQFNSTNADLSMTWYPGKQNSLQFHGKDGILFRDYLLETLNAPTTDNLTLNNNNNTNRLTQDVDCISVTLQDLCEVVSDNNTTFEASQPVQDTCGCGRYENDMKKVKLDINFIQSQISSINNVIDSTHNIIERLSDALHPSERDGGLYNSRIESIVQEFSLIIDAKNKVIKDRDNTLNELQNKLLKIEGEKVSFSTQTNCLSDLKLITELNNQDTCKSKKGNLHVRSRTCESDKHHCADIPKVNSPDPPTNVQCNAFQPDELEIITPIPVPVISSTEPLSNPAYKSTEKSVSDRDIICLGNLPLVDTTKSDACRNIKERKKGYNNHLNSRINRINRQVKEHLEVPQSVNHLETPFHYHRPWNKPPSIPRRPTANNHRFLDKKKSRNRPFLSELHTGAQEPFFLPLIGGM